MTEFAAIRLYKIVMTMIVITILFSCCHKQRHPAIRIAFYNTENLFDTENNPTTQDDEFTPEGGMKWDRTKYKHKLRNISRVIRDIGQEHSLAMIGLCEVENEKVIRDLLRQNTIRNSKYEFLITHSKDTRGSNVCLLYSPSLFQPYNVSELTPLFKDNQIHTRNILHITGCLSTIPKDTIDIYVCHFPSRWGGTAKTIPLRNACALLLKNSCDSINKEHPLHSILIMGDFNDYPYSQSIKQVLKVRINNEHTSKNKLFNLFAGGNYQGTNWGSYKYKNEWGFMDQLIINGQFAYKWEKASGQKVTGKVFAPAYLLRNDYKYGGKIPFRTFWGKKYIGGYSDHLPIYTDIYTKSNCKEN